MSKIANIEKNIQKTLFELQDPKYKDFQAKLIPNLNIDKIIGVRTPILRKYATDLSKTEEGKNFLKILPHKYYDEYNLHGFLIEKCKDFDEAIRLIEEFLPYIDNWATCDIVSPKVLKKNLPELLKRIENWVASRHPWTVRFGIGLLMRYFLDENFDIRFPKMLSKIKSDEYYVKMMIAWYFATALAKQPDRIMPYFEKQILEPWVHNKAIQKSLESFRIKEETKVLLRKMRV